MSHAGRITALAALATALTGIGSAGAGTATTVGPAIDVRFATVSSTGSLVAAQSYGAASASRLSNTDGKVKVVFDTSIARCAVSAVSLAGETTSNVFGYQTRIMTAISGSSLYVTMMGKNDVPDIYPFSVVLACNP